MKAQGSSCTSEHNCGIYSPVLKSKTVSKKSHVAFALYSYAWWVSNSNLRRDTN